MKMTIRVSRRLAAGLLVLALFGRAEAKQSTHIEGACSGKQEGTTATVGYTLRIKKKPFLLDTTLARDIIADTATQTTVLSRGKVSALRVELASSGAGSTMRVAFGKGFKGVHEIDLAPDGNEFRAVVDGRRTTLFPAGTNATTVAFEDGKPAPRLHVRRDLKKALSVFVKAGLPQCLRDYAGITSSSLLQAQDSGLSERLLGFIHSARGTAQPQDSLEPPCQKDAFGTCDSFPGCNACKAFCAAKAFECGTAAVTGAAVGGIFGFVVAGVVCIADADDCSDACEKEGNACCPKNCSGRCTGPKESVCCGEITSSNSGICPAEECCGSQDAQFCCLVGYTCRDAAHSLCCKPEEGDPCFNNRECCPVERPRCVPGTRAQTQTCCPDGQSTCGSDANFNDLCCPNGRCCTGPSGTNCCAEGEMCLPGGECCAPGDVCGGTCCPSHVCINNSICCAPPNSAVCGGKCCPALGNTCCNGDCCTGACIAGVCCPVDSVCGPTCCPAGHYCANSQTGLCVACPSGQSPCAGSENGGPTCCPTSIQCCVTGCCPGGTECCAPTTEPLGCYTTCVR